MISVQGVQTTLSAPSAFKDDEYVIYNVDQQQQRYLVEFVKAADGMAIRCVDWLFIMLLFCFD
jgi:hypothetical protein